MCVYLWQSLFLSYFQVWRPVVSPEGEKHRVNAGESHLRSGVFQCACSEDDRTTDGLLMSFKVTDRGGFLS